MRRVAALAVLALVVAGLAAPARANGRFPRSVKVVFRPGQPTELMIGVTFGLLVSKDDGATWRWVCENAIGFSGTFDPDYEYSASGAIFATTFDGLKVTRDGCHWDALPAPLGTTFVSSVAVGPDGTIWAGTSDPVIGSAIYKSTDDGQSFVATAPLGQTGDWWETIEVAPGDPQRLYVTGFRLAAGMPRERLLYRSHDGGQTWTQLPVTAFVGTNNSDLQIAAISPTDPALVFVRMTLVGPTLQEAIYRSDDAGAAAPTWTKVLDVPDNVPGVVVRADGEVWAATPFRGLFRSQDGGRTFAVVPGVTFEGRCLTERGDGTLYLCTNNLPPDGATIHTSTTGTGGWIAKLSYADLAGPVRCPADTVQHTACEQMLWCGLKANLGILTDEIDCTDAGVNDGGLVDAGIDAAGPGSRDKGCCSVNAGPGGAAASTVLVVLGLIAIHRRRRRGGSVERCCPGSIASRTGPSTCR